MQHISLTIEESTGSATGRVHLHAQFTFERRIDRTCLDWLLCLPPMYVFLTLSSCAQATLSLFCIGSLDCSLPSVSFQHAHLRNYDCFAFGFLKPHVQCNHARGKEVLVSRARSHFYVVCKKIGSLWNWTNWEPFVSYEVNPSWVTSWWSVQTLGWFGW